MESSNNNQSNGQGFAIASLVIGIIALLIAIIPCIGVTAILLGALAVIFGAIALSQATNNNSPKGMSIAGLTLGIVSLSLAIFWITFVVDSTSKFENRANNIFGFFDDIDDSTEWEEDYDAMETLDNLEETLDELEIETYEVDSDSIVVDIEK